jgi:hypothetical protein
MSKETKIHKWWHFIFGTQDEYTDLGTEGSFHNCSYKTLCKKCNQQIGETRYYQTFTTYIEIKK